MSCFGVTIIHILWRTTLNLPENILKMILPKCWTFWSTIYCWVWRIIFQQTVDIPMGTNCATRLADLFLYSYEAEFIRNLLKEKKKKHYAKFFNLNFRYIDNVLSLNNPNFSQYLYLIYPSELEIKDSTDSRRTDSYLDLFLNIDTDGRLHTKIYEKLDDFNFPIINFPFLSSNIPSASTWCLHISIDTYVILVLVHTIQTSYTGVCSLRRNCSNKVMRRTD